MIPQKVIIVKERSDGDYDVCMTINNDSIGFSQEEWKAFLTAYKQAFHALIFEDNDTIDVYERDTFKYNEEIDLT